jgi:hypothetical protein
MLQPQTLKCRTTCFRNLQDLVWQHPDFMRLLERLEQGRDAGYSQLVLHLKTIFAALAELYAQLNSPDIKVLQHAEAKFGAAVRPVLATPCLLVRIG